MRTHELKIYPERFGERLLNREEMETLHFSKGKSVVEIEPFNQKENGGKGITYTLYYYPNGLGEDYDIAACETFDAMKEAIEAAKRILGE